MTRPRDCLREALSWTRCRRCRIGESPWPGFNETYHRCRTRGKAWRAIARPPISPERPGGRAGLCRGAREALLQRSSRRPAEARGCLKRRDERGGGALPADLDAATLYAEALMNLARGSLDCETSSRTDSRDRRRTRDVLPGSDHPGANHYLHAVEPQRRRACAASAMRLGSIMPVPVISFICRAHLPAAWVIFSRRRR